MKIQAYRCTWDGDPGWMQYHDHTCPLPKKWDDEPPDETAALVLKIDADIEIDRLRTLMHEAMRDFHGKSVLFSSAFLLEAEKVPNSNSPTPPVG
ncbi:MAG: hypothetical protein U0932_14440 [Thiobacillus sp.]|nr:hypothetical protein [Thiobacillus sp.]